MNEFYSLLMQFAQESEACRKHLLKNYDEDLINKAITNGYLYELRKNDIGDPVYAITEKGKRKRDY